MMAAGKGRRGKEREGKANLNLPGTINLGSWVGGHRCRLRFIVFE